MLQKYCQKAEELKEEFYKSEVFAFYKDSVTEKHLERVLSDDPDVKIISLFDEDLNPKQKETYASIKEIVDEQNNKEKQQLKNIKNESIRKAREVLALVENQQNIYEDAKTQHNDKYKAN